jgi:hypothetical protein
VLYDMLLKELDTLTPAGSGSAAAAPARQASPSCQSGEAAAGRGKQKKAASAPGAAAAGRKAAAAAAGSKRSRLDWSDDDSDAEEQQQPAAQRIKPQQQAQQPAAAYATAAGAAASPPSISGAAAGGGSSSSGGPAALASHPRRTSSSRGSDHADESWIEEHADRQPEPAAPITSREVSPWTAVGQPSVGFAVPPACNCLPALGLNSQPASMCFVSPPPKPCLASVCTACCVPQEYRRREAAFNAKYLSYFELHQLIQAHKKDYEALDALAREAPTMEERQRCAFCDC